MNKIMSATSNRKSYLMVVVWAAVGTALTCISAFGIITSLEGWGRPFIPYEGAPTANVIREDFPEWKLSTDPNGHHDGTQFYVMARHPFDMTGEGANLDRPEYRWQRPFFAWVASTGYYLGGPNGLVAAFHIVNVVALLAGGIFTGLIALHWKGKAILAAAFPLLPGAFFSVLIAVADTLALALFLGGLLLLLKKKPILASGAFVLACLTKEAMLLLVGAYLLGCIIYLLRQKVFLKTILKQEKVSLILPAALPFLVVLGWAFFVRVILTFSTNSAQVVEFTPPFVGTWETIQIWIENPPSNQFAIATWLITIGVVVVAFIRSKISHPLALPTITSLAFLFLMSPSVIALNANATRMLLPSLLLGLLMFGTQKATYELNGSTDAQSTDVESLRQ
jgi:hypothetical protein